MFKKLKKTPTELKSEALLRSYKKKQSKASKKNKSKRKKLPYESFKELKMMKYNVFLQSKYWAHVRKVVLKRDNYKCIICKSDQLLQVHHDTYKNHCRELEHLQDLMTLCKNCHQEHHYAQS